MKSRQFTNNFAALGFRASVLAFALCSFSASSNAAPVASAEATVLSFPSGTTNQSTVTSLTADSRTLTTGWTNATYDATNGMVVEVAPGTYSFGFGSYVPESYTGPGYMYLHRVVIKDQANAILLDETFDGWAQVGSSTTTGSITRSQYTTTAGTSWSTYGDGTSYLATPFTSVNVSGDNGVSYPMDGSGPFSVLIKTLVTAPAGTTHLRVSAEWRYDVNIFSGANRLFTIGVKQGDVPTENLFSFSAPAAPPAPATPEPIPTLSEWASILLASLMGMFAITRMRRR